MKGSVRLLKPVNSENINESTPTWYTFLSLFIKSQWLYMFRTYWPIFRRLCTVAIWYDASNPTHAITQNKLTLNKQTKKSVPSWCWFINVPRCTVNKTSNSEYNTRQQDFGTWKFYCVSNVTFHAEFKYAINSSCTMTFLLLIFRNFGYFLQRFLNTWTNILNGFEQRVVSNNLPVSNY
jgi:hypothetical protein